ncbi:hypothetical protein SPF06_00990 [Sinomonas sp. JGH33]|uniref:DNA-binding phage zinc finger domain-containing protein n=1 Tax=Sinomonas terricola TaxID=3110330 RepID=A0ABU5T0V5_9MICC|nr:hypothetical protein [Sinomonas sp. JGH33]MEA5453286.1 hypothetical protein [Sinomonas sp. JGH33]
MTPDETKKFLAKVQIIDSRTVDLATIATWHEAIGHNDFADVMMALDAHRRSSTAWVTPAHINELVKLMKLNRESLRNRARAIGAGPTPPIQGPPDWFRAEAGLTIPEEHPDVKCPHCGAKPHSPCMVRGARRERPMREPHPSRLEAVSAEAASSLPETEEEPPW